MTVVDLDSTNGTFVDGCRVPHAVVSPASHVQLGCDVVVELYYLPEVRPLADANLTNREREVAALVCAGFANEEIANQLGVARRTVTTHVSRILSKAGVGSRLELIRICGSA